MKAHFGACKDNNKPQKAYSKQQDIAIFALTAGNNFHLYSHSTDMRKSFDAMSGLVGNNLGCNLTGGEVFIFFNKRRDKIRLLHWQGPGYRMKNRKTIFNQ